MSATETVKYIDYQIDTQTKLMRNRKKLEVLRELLDSIHQRIELIETLLKLEEA